MDIRIILYILIILGGVVYKLIGENHQSFDERKHYIIFICIILGLESGLRHLSVGPDTYSYYLQFKHLQLDDWNIFNRFIDAYVYGYGRDPGFPIMVKTFQIFSNSFQLFLIFIAIPYFASLGVFLYRNTKHLRDVIFAFVLYVSLFQIIGLSGIRQQIATAISLFALIYIQKRKPLKFFLLIFLGSTIHASLLIMLPFYFLSFLKAKYIKYLYYLPFLFFPLIVVSGSKIMGFLAGFFQNDYYMGYVYSEGGGNALNYVIISLMVGIFSFLNMKKILNLDYNNKIYYIAIALMILFLPLIMLNGSLIRVGQYFSLYMMIIIPLIINRLKIKLNIKYLIFSLITIALLYLSLRKPFEYLFFWQDVEIF